MASMIFQSFGVPTLAIESMLTTIQNMKFFLHTGYGDSTNYVGGESMDKIGPVKNQGMCQGNTTAPAAWAVTSIPMIAAQKRKGHGAHLIPPVKGITGHIVGGLFVDDTDLVHRNVLRRTLRTSRICHQLGKSADCHGWGSQAG